MKDLMQCDASKIDRYPDSELRRILPELKRTS